MGLILTSMEGRLLPGALTERQSESEQSVMREIDSPALDRENKDGSDGSAPKIHPYESSVAENPTATAKAGLRRRLGTLARVMGALARAIDWITTLPLQWAERNRARRYLRGLNDYMLKDLGLSRADVEHESSKWFWRE